MILINGCSFTFGSALKDPSCVYSVDYCNQRSLPFTNIAIDGSSNENIRSTTISELLTGKYKFAMVNWTTPWRLVLGGLIPNRCPINIFPNHYFDGINIDGNDQFNLVKFWQVFYDGFYYHRNYFESVFLVQEFCRSRNIGYVFTNTNNLMQVSAWKNISQTINENKSHPDTYIDHFSGFNRDHLQISYDRFYKKNDMAQIKQAFKRITSYVDAIDWDRFVGLNEEPFFQWPNPTWPTELDNIHPGKEAHLYWRNVLDRSAWLTQEIINLKNSL